MYNFYTVTNFYFTFWVHFHFIYIICIQKYVYNVCIVVVGILLSQKTMEYMPRISLWLSCSACCGYTAQSCSNKLCCSYCRCSLHLALWLLMLPSAICALSSLPPILSPLLTCLNACLDYRPPTAAVCSYSFPVLQIDVACLLDLIYRCL